MTIQFTRAVEIIEHGNFSEGTLRRLIRKGLWTRPAAITERLRAWPQHEVDALLTIRESGATNEQIHALVTQFEARRPDSIRPSKLNENPRLIAGRAAHFEKVRKQSGPIAGVK